MISFSRTDGRIFGRWWWTVDRVMLFSFLIMMAFGVLMAMAATPMVASRIGVETSYFLKRHLLYVLPSLLTIFSVSLLDRKGLRRFSLVLFLFSIFLTLLTLFLGAEIKGACRWIPIFGFSLQPSEFTKPALAVITAWMFSEQHRNPEFRGKFMASLLLGIFIVLLLLQPDVGAVVITAFVWFGQLFLNGLPVIFAVGVAVAMAGGFVLAYMFLPHVAARVDRFMNPEIGDHYQIGRSLEAFANGGLFGVGPGEGVIKKHVPDAHADFVFAVLGEEFGFFVCLLVVVLIAFLVIYGMLKSLKENDLFSILASVGLLCQFGLQSFVNIASALQIIPTKGMTLPFISYGGSSMMATSIAVGMILALGRRRTYPWREIVY
ncbi:MAG: putative lipid II flippase FtsW [Holosporaceae bacterium]|jgi:cell division protein FtsW|nr:putative lipid II flippase FtsW [Holosporaceae bacterium]